MAVNYKQQLSPQPTPLGQMLRNGPGAADPQGAYGQPISQMSIADMMGLRSSMQQAQSFMDNPVTMALMPFSAQLAFNLVANDVNTQTANRIGQAQAFGMNGNVNNPQGLASIPPSAFRGPGTGAASGGPSGIGASVGAAGGGFGGAGVGFGGSGSGAY